VERIHDPGFRGIIIRSGWGEVAQFRLRGWRYQVASLSADQGYGTSQRDASLAFARRLQREVGG
jgi:hypothetical protein